MNDVEVKVVRPFLLKGERKGKGETVAVPKFLALDLIAANKAVAVESASAPAEEPKPQQQQDAQTKEPPKAESGGKAAANKEDK